MPRKTPKKRLQPHQRPQEQELQQSPGSAKRLETINEGVVTVFEVPFCLPQARSSRVFEAIVVITILLLFVSVLAWWTPETTTAIWQPLKDLVVGMANFIVNLPFALVGIAYRILGGQWTFFDCVMMLWGWLAVMGYCGTRYMLKLELSRFSYYGEDNTSDESDEDAQPIRIISAGSDESLLDFS